MNWENFTNPSGWWEIFWGLVAAGLIKVITPLITAWVKSTLNNTKGKLRIWVWRRTKKYLLYYRELNCDEMLLTREISRSAVYLTVFLTSILFWLGSSVFLLISFPETPSPIWIGIGTPPMYTFEIMWALKSRKLDDFFKYRKKIRQRNQHRSTRNTSALSSPSLVECPALA